MARPSNQQYPPVGFYFSVQFDGIPGVGEGQENFFQEVSGLNREIEIETVKSGGENRFSYKLPLRGQYPNLVLKRGLFVDSAAIKWFQDTLVEAHGILVRPFNVLVTLLNEQGKPLQSYHCINAWPVKWSPGDFNAGESRIVVESLELAYQYFKVV